MSYIPVTKRMVIDVREIAELIEQKLEKDFLPINPTTSSMHLSDVSSALMHVAPSTFRSAAQEETKIVEPKLVRGGRNRVPAPIPHRGLALCLAVVDGLIDDRSTVYTKRPQHTLGELFGPYLNYEFINNVNSMEKLHEILIDLRTDVTAFMGTNGWIMHFAHLNYTDIIVEQTIDYRIFDWMRRMENKEW